MKLLFSSLVCAFLFNPFAFAKKHVESPIPNFMVVTYSLDTTPHQWVMVATPPLKNHFNIQAPISAVVKSETAGKQLSFTISEQSEKSVVFRLMSSEVTPNDRASVSLFMCDDAKTYCAKKTLDFTIGLTLRKDVPEKFKIKTGAAPKSALTKPVPTPIATEKDSNGFWANAPEQAFAEAKRLNKPLMIDFYGIWCPPCNMFNELVFPTEKFKKATQDFVLLKMDADKDSSWDLKSRFKVGGYPTIVFAKINSDGSLQEIDRVVGFLNLNDFAKRVSHAFQNKGQTLVEHVQSLKGKPEYLPELKRLITFYTDEHEYVLAKKAAEEGLKAAPNDVELKLVMIESHANDLKKDKNKLHDYFESAEVKKVIAEAYEKRKALSPQALFDAVSMAISAVAFKKEALDWIAELYTRVNPKTLFIDNMEASIADIDGAKMDLAEATDDESLLKEAREAGVISYQKLIQLYQNKDSRGFNLELAYLLRKTQRTDEAKALYARFIKKYPHEFTFYYAAAKFYLELKELKVAREMIDNAVKYAYGDNKARCIETLAKVMHEQGEAAQAIEAIEQFLAEFKAPPEALKLRTKRYLDALRELDEKYQKEKKI